ncbi:hypothetical protein TNCV_428791 [Trichonephila clavipes]|nr:hypothetical protein TNCV_428791 [Trichonephila clavipes]
MPLDNKCRIGPMAGAPPDTCAVVISTETESGFLTEDDTSPVCHTPSEVGKIQSTLPMMWGQCDVVGAEVATLLIARSSRSFVFLGRPDPPTVHSTFCDPLLPTPSNYHIAPTEVAADTSIRPICFSEAYYTAPIKKSVSCSYCRRLRLRGILSLNIVYQSHQIRLDSRTALVLMLLNYPSCATNMRIAHT